MNPAPAVGEAALAHGMIEDVPCRGDFYDEERN
jgi:hypothetical protein